MKYELTSEQKRLCEESGRIFRERIEDHASMAEAIVIHTIMEYEMLDLARAIAEPLAAEIATLETLNESAKGQIKAQAERIAELEAQLARSAKVNEPIQDERNTDWD